MDGPNPPGPSFLSPSRIFHYYFLLHRNTHIIFLTEHWTKTMGDNDCNGNADGGDALWEVDEETLNSGALG